MNSRISLSPIIELSLSRERKVNYVLIDQEVPNNSNIINLID